ncbi:uncharacterized protein LOC106650327 [Trichogramma pretiosum]|uniref:Replication protein A OB domain-containing protein n=1 Tax=Trichogramma kaykai TaxID=54128 RepID=A0ABD2VUC7_9HYME|nr:uncharacterized protein LOC106650327 [Trichogramma pretiosum]
MTDDIDAVKTIKDFTSNDVLDSIEFNDKSVEIIGFVDAIQRTENSCKSRYHKFVLNNGQGKRVQVVAWNEHVPAVDKITQFYKIVHARNLIAHKPLHRIYNLGNVDYELLLVKGSVIETYDTYYNDKENVVKTTICEAIDQIGIRIRIEAYVKSGFEKCKKDDQPYYFGCITDGYFQLDLKLAIDIDTSHLRKGQAISVIGVMEQGYKRPARLCVSSQDDIVVLDKSDMPVIEVHLGNRYPQRFS